MPRRAAEEAILADIRGMLQSDTAFQRFQRAVAAALTAHRPDTGALQRQLREAERARDNIMAAIRAGIITPTTKAELERAEEDARQLLTQLDAARRYEPAAFLPRLREVWAQALARLNEHARATPAAREALRELIGEIRVRQNEKGDLVAEIADSSATQITMVAGAGFGRYLLRGREIVITRGRP